MTSISKAIEEIRNGKVGVIPTDTIYGLVCSVRSRGAVERIYDIKKRELVKPCVILINEMSELTELGVEIDNVQEEILKQYWPGPISVEFDCNPSLEYLHRGTGHIGVRLPKDNYIREILKETGPIIATSANLSGQEPATNINTAKEYFGDSVDFFLDGGELEGNPSKIIKVVGDEVEVIRG